MGSLGSLKELHLNFNQFGDDGMVAFAEALKPNPSNPMGAMANLKELCLFRNQIGNDGMIAFAEALKPNPSNPKGAMGLLTVSATLHIPHFHLSAYPPLVCWRKSCG